MPRSVNEDSTGPAHATDSGRASLLTLPGSLPTFVLFALGLLLSLLGFIAAQRAALAPLEDEVQRTALHLTGATRYAFTENIQALRSVGALYSSSQEVTRQEFHAFSRVVLEQYPGIRALSWAPRVAAQDRDEFEAAAAAEIPGFVITEQGPEATLQLAGRGRDLFPVFFLEPLRGNEPALGFDLASEESRRTTLERAAESGELLATPRLRLVQENGPGFGILFVLPVYRPGFVNGSAKAHRDAVEGFLTEVVSFPRTLDLAVRDFPSHRMEMVLCDLSAPPSERFLWASDPVMASDEGICAPMSAGPDDLVSILDVGGREWSLRVAPTSVAATFQRTWPAWIVLAFGILLSVLLGAHLHEGRLHAVALVEANSALNSEIGERTKAELRLRQANHQLERLSREDPLMGIANRRRVDEYLAHEWQRAIRSGTPLALILLDVDHFKPFNDTYGHLDGDDCLKRVARAAAGVLSRPGDLIGRFGGDELAVVLPETNVTGALGVARRIHAAVAALAIPHASSPTSDEVSVTAGVGATVPTTSSSLLGFIRKVDSALYAAKEAGRNQVVAADGERE